MDLTLNRVELARQVADLLELPHQDYYGVAHQVVATVVKTIVDGLLRGEEVRIDGFGIFRRRQKKAQKRGGILYSTSKPTRLYNGILEYPETTRVVFKPSKALLRYINEHT